MKVAVLYSGGKDSTYSLWKVVKEGYDVRSLITVKPSRHDSYLWHYATVGLTRLSSEALGIPLVYVNCDRVGPDEEASVIESAIKGIDADALVLGGVGLQRTQVNSLKRVLAKVGKELILPCEGYSSEELLKEEVKLGMEIIVTGVAANGLGPEWLGRRLDQASFKELIETGRKYGFDVLGEGGHYDTFVTDMPLFKKSIRIVRSERVWDRRIGWGYLDVREALLIPK